MHEHLCHAVLNDGFFHLYDTALTAMTALDGRMVEVGQSLKLATLSTTGCFKMHPRNAPFQPSWPLKVFCQGFFFFLIVH